MAQDRRKEDLKKLLAFVGNIIREPGNSWFAEELYRILAPSSDSRIKDIHEQCVETILNQQAEEFYHDFPISEIKDQLISDYNKMGHWQRRNNFQEFCMALYQQLECIVNYLCKQETNILIWRNIRNANFFVDLNANDIRVRGKGKTIKESVIYKSENYDKELNELPAMDKFKAALFLIVYKTNVTWNNKDTYNSDFNIGNDIYRLRNMNHRGSESTDNQSIRINKALENPIRTMIQYLEFYARFISGVISGYALSVEIIEFAESCIRSNAETN